MAVTVKVNGNLKNCLPDNPDGIVSLDEPGDRNLKSLIENLGIDFIDLGFCAVNNRIVSKMEILKGIALVKDGDRVEVFSEMKGG